MLVTATVTGAGWGSAPTFTDDPLNPNGTKTDIKLVHLTELRTAVNQLRSHAGLSSFSFTVDASPTQYVTTVKADHIRQLRTALEQALTALHLPTGGYAHATLTEQSSTIYAVDFQELRNQITAAWSNVTINWMVTDQLGTPRMIFDQSGSLASVSRHDYLPFGEELFAGTGGRTSDMGYTPGDSARQKFTSKERDAETGLDYFEARYYSSTQGRFTSVDPINLTEERLTDPQQINLYQYTRNDPLNLLDPTGETVDFEKDKNGNLTKNGKYSQEEYEEYKAFLLKNKTKYAAEIDTIAKLERSQINYKIQVTTKELVGSQEVEGSTSTNGTDVLVTIRNQGNGHEKFTLQGRFAHELEHARQFDDGEFSFVKTASGEWTPNPASYDIYDEVRAFKAQIAVTAEANDTQMLRKLRDDRLTDSKRAGVLRSNYPKRTQTDQNVTYLWGAPPGAIVRPNAQHPKVFGVVHK